MQISNEVGYCIFGLQKPNAVECQKGETRTDHFPFDRYPISMSPYKYPRVKILALLPGVQYYPSEFVRGSLMIFNVTNTLKLHLIKSTKFEYVMETAS